MQKERWVFKKQVVIGFTICPNWIKRCNTVWDLWTYPTLVFLLETEFHTHWSLSIRPLLEVNCKMIFFIAP